MSGVIAQPEGITQPPIDELLDRVESKYALVVSAAKRARQINIYNQQLEDTMITTPGPLVPVAPEDKPLSIALREIREDLLIISDSPKSTNDVAADIDIANQLFSAEDILGSDLSE